MYKNFNIGDRVTLKSDPNYRGEIINKEKVVYRNTNPSNKIEMVKIRWDKSISLDFGEWMDIPSLQLEKEFIREEKLNQLGL